LREYYYDHYARPDAQLLDAAVNGDITLARKALYQGAKVNAKDEDGGTALMKSAGFGHTAIVEVLLTKGADVNAKDKDGYTALMSAAAQSGDAASVEVLLTKGADVNTKNQHGFTALMKATERGYTAVVEVLLAKGADVNAKHKRGWTALSIAKENGYTDIVQLLKQAGAVMADEATKKPQETVRDLFNDPTFETMPFDVKLDRFYKASKNDHAYQKMSDDGKKVVHQRFFSSKALADPPQPR